MEAYSEEFYPDQIDIFETHTNSNYNFIKSLFYIFFIGFTGITVSIVVISIVLFNDYKTWNNNNPDYDNESESHDYEDKYTDDYDELSNRSMEEGKIAVLKNIFISDETPKGIIKMSYDINNNAFCYYIDNKDIPNKYLETAARFYVIQHDCKYLYINYEDEYNKAVEIQKTKILEREEKIEKEKQLEEAKKNSVFARFRNYNTDTNTDCSNIQDIPIVLKKSNHFIYKGKLSDWDEYSKFISNNNENEDTDNEYENLDYASFKKLEENKKSV